MVQGERTKFSILYAAVEQGAGTQMHRLAALRRLGQHVEQFGAMKYEAAGSALARKIRLRTVMGPTVARYNHDLRQAAKELKPDVVWCDKQLLLQPQTLRTFRKLGIASASYMIDDPFGPRQDPGFRVYKQALPDYDLHLVQRDVSVADYKRKGARNVLKVQTAFERTAHYPPPATWSDANRNREVSFLGTPYDDRAEVLTELWKKHGVPLVISGPFNPWKRKLSPDAYAALYREGELTQDAYRDGIWRSKMNLSFITHSNRDEVTQKSFEIVGCGQLLLVERSAGHLERFKEDEEAVFFSSMDECAAKVRKYLPDEAARRRIAAAGHKRAIESGYDNDAQMAKALDALEEIVPAVKRAAGM